METLNATVGDNVFEVNQFRSAFHINAQMIGKDVCDMVTCPSQRCQRNRQRLAQMSAGQQLCERLNQKAMTPESKAKTMVVVDSLRDLKSGRAKKLAPLEPVVVLHFTHDNIGESGQGGDEGDEQAGAAGGGHSGGGGGGGGNGARGTDSAQHIAGDWPMQEDETEDDEDGDDPKGPSRSAAVAKRGSENAAATTEQGGKRLRPAAGGVGAARDRGKSAASDKGGPRAVSTEEASDAMKQLMNTFCAKGGAALKAPVFGAGTSAPLARGSAFGAASVPAASSAQHPFMDMLRQSTRKNSLAAGRQQVDQGALSPGVAPTLVNSIQGAPGSAGEPRRESNRRAEAAQQRASISGAGRSSASLETLHREQEDATLAAPPPVRVLSSASSSASASAVESASAGESAPAAVNASLDAAEVGIDAESAIAAANALLDATDSVMLGAIAPAAAAARAVAQAALPDAVPAVLQAAPEGLAVAPALRPQSLTDIAENFMLEIASFFNDQQLDMGGMQDQLQVLSANFQDLESEHKLLQATSSVAVRSLADMTEREEERNAELNRLQSELHEATTALTAAHAAAAAGSSEALILSQAALSAANAALNLAREETTAAQSEAQAATAAAAAATSACEMAQSTLDGLKANMMAMFSGNALFARGLEGGQGGAAGGGPGGAAGGQ